MLAGTLKKTGILLCNYFEKAKEIDPNYALAYVGISNVWIVRAIFSLQLLKKWHQ